VHGRWVGRIVLAGERWWIPVIVSSKCIMIMWGFSVSWISRWVWMVDGRPFVMIVIVLVSGIAMERTVRLMCYSMGWNNRCRRDRSGWDGGRWGRPGSLRRLRSGRGSLLRLRSRCGCLSRLES
jgi:hypothetical protein